MRKLLSLGLSFSCWGVAPAQNATSSPSAILPDASKRAVTASVVSSEKPLPGEICIGDRPGDVVRVTTAQFVGIPLALANGAIMVWSGAKEGETQDAQAAFSTDNGLTWTKPRTLFQFPPGKAQWGGQASLVDDKGYLHLLGLEYYSFDFKNRATSKSHLWHARSLNAGKTWEPVQRIECGYSYVGCCSGAFQTKTGRIIAPLSVMSNREIGAFISLCPYSDDYGATWNTPKFEITTNTGARDWYESGNAEPVGIQLKDGRLWLTTRSQDGFQWETFSKDDGLTWSPAQHTRFVSNQSQMTVFRMKDGRLLILWNNCGAEALPPVKWQWAERAVLAAAISDDEGETWRGYREIMRALVPRIELSNPYVVEMPNDRLLVYASGVLCSVDPDFVTRSATEERFDQEILRWSTLASKGVSVVTDPDGGSGRVLKMIKPDSNVTSAACFNFPFGQKGEIGLVLRVEPGFQGTHLTLSDHYDLPGLPRDASFPMQINAKGRILLNGSGGTWLSTPGDLVPGKWHKLKLTWDCANHEALLELDGVEIGRLHQYVQADGVCYLRVRSTAATTDDAGMYIKSVKISTEP